MQILQPGFEVTVRSRFGIDADDLPDTELNQPLIVDLAEATIMKRVPDYAIVTDVADQLYLQNAVINQICYILCPSMAKRLNLKIAISDVKIEKDRINWDDMAQNFLLQVETSLSSVTTVTVTTGMTSDHVLVDKIKNERKPIGGEW